MYGGLLMATLTRLASTLTAKYYPSPSLTDAFYMDGRLCGKRETRQADITTDKDERGFLFSIFTHPAIKGVEPGTLPPYEPQLRDLCNNVKFGYKDIDSLIEKFMTCAVDITGMMKLSDGESRTPYFSGVIVKDQLRVFPVRAEIRELPNLIGDGVVIRRLRRLRQPDLFISFR